MKHATLSHTNLSKKRAKKELRRKRVLRSRKALERDLLFQFRLTIKHFFPKIDKWLKRIDDPRQKKKTDYGIRELMWMGLLILCTPTESLNKYEEDYFFEESVTNLKKVFNLQIDRIQHWGMKFPNALVLVLSAAVLVIVIENCDIFEKIRLRVGARAGARARN